MISHDSVMSVSHKVDSNASKLVNRLLTQVGGRAHEARAASWAQDDDCAVLLDKSHKELLNQLRDCECVHQGKVLRTFAGL
jgi:hypothetical protein